MKRSRDAIAQMAIYDLLCRMQKNAIDQHYKVFPCIIGMITGEQPIWSCSEYMDGTHAECDKCIAAWLNEPYDGRW